MKICAIEVGQRKKHEKNTWKCTPFACNSTWYTQFGAKKQQQSIPRVISRIEVSCCMFQSYDKWRTIPPSWSFFFVAVSWLLRHRLYVVCLTIRKRVQNARNFTLWNLFFRRRVPTPNKIMYIPGGHDPENYGRSIFNTWWDGFLSQSQLHLRLTRRRLYC